MSGVELAAGVAIGARRVLAKRALAGAAVAIATGAAGALAEKKVSLVGAASRALEGSAFGFLVPIVVFGVVGTVLPRTRLDDAAAPLARFGASRRTVALGLVLASMAAGAAAAAALGVTAAVLAHDPAAPPLATDALACAWIGLLTGAAYAALFSLGATFGAKGGGRTLALFADFALGGTSGIAGALLPRAHAMNLLGGPPPFALSQPASAGALALLALAFSGLAISRVRP